jgi:hypothetical protein
MGLRKAKADPTPDQLHENAIAHSQTALATFYGFIDDLETSAALHDDAAAKADAEAAALAARLQELSDLQAKAREASENKRRKAEQIAALVS